jgi:hypothetical protein
MAVLTPPAPSADIDEVVAELAPTDADEAA